MNKCSKICLSFLIILLILVVAMVFNTLLQSFNSRYKKKNETNVTEVCEETLTDDQMKALFEKHEAYVNSSDKTEEQQKSLDDDKYVEKNSCYCAQYNYLEIIKDLDGRYKYCEEIILALVTTVSVAVATGVFISIINFVLVIIISKLILWIPFRSLSTQIAVQIIYITVALFINTIVRLTRSSFL